MIPRYSRSQMSDIWKPENKFQIWFEIEAHACDAQAELGNIPKKAAKDVWEKGKFNIERIDKIEKETKHDVIAFLTNLSENIGENARFVHKGMTSSDILDTCLSIQLSQSADLLLKGIHNLLEALRNNAERYKHTLCIGRSHGIHAEPTTFGLKLLQAYSEFKRNYKRLIVAKEEVSICAISGAVGTFANIDPYVETYVANKLGLKSEDISSQIIPRDRHAAFFSTLGIIAGSIERISTEIRHLQRTEVMEVEEFFSSGQKGSSAMPHKRNPVLTENLTGLSRLIRGYVNPSLESISLWHERDISHSAFERVAAPDATIALDFAIDRLTSVVKNLIIYPENMLKNMNRLKGLINSQRIMLELIDNGTSREDAYKIIQENAMTSWNESIDFIDCLKLDKRVTEKINSNKLIKLFDLNYHTKHINTIFERVLSE